MFNILNSMACSTFGRGLEFVNLQKIVGFSVALSFLFFAPVEAAERAKLAKNKVPKIESAESSDSVIELDDIELPTFEEYQTFSVTKRHVYMLLVTEAYMEMAQVKMKNFSALKESNRGHFFALWEKVLESFCSTAHANQAGRRRLCGGWARQDSNAVIGADLEARYATRNLKRGSRECDGLEDLSGNSEIKRAFPRVNLKCDKTAAGKTQIACNPFIFCPQASGGTKSVFCVENNGGETSACIKKLEQATGRNVSNPRAANARANSSAASPSKIRKEVVDKYKSALARAARYDKCWVRRTSSETHHNRPELSTDGINSFCGLLNQIPMDPNIIKDFRDACVAMQGLKGDTGERFPGSESVRYIASTNHMNRCDGAQAILRAAETAENDPNSAFKCGESNIEAYNEYVGNVREYCRGNRGSLCTTLLRGITKQSANGADREAAFPPWNPANR